MKKIFGLKNLLQEQLRDLYDAMVQYDHMLPNMVELSTSEALRRQLQVITAETHEATYQLAHACRLLDVPPDGITCEAMRGLVREAKETTSEWGDTATIDAALIANAQRIVHYQIAGFGTARSFARCLKLPELTTLLDPLLSQAGLADKALTQIAIGGWFSGGVNHDSALAA